MFSLSNRLINFLALGILVSPSLAQSSPDTLSCVNNASNGTIYTSAAGKYEILCATDYGGGDMGATSTSTFEGCIAACDASPGCIDVSYVGGACYMKNRLNAASYPGHVWTAKKIIAAVPVASESGSATASPTPAATKLTCANNLSDGTTYTAAKGVYQILCATDYAGGDMGAKQSATFEECIDACDSTPGCIDVSYVGTACYLKNKLNDALSRGHVWTAKFIAMAEVPSSASSFTSSAGHSGSSSTASTTGSMPVTSSAASSSPTSTPSVGPLSCHDKKSHGIEYSASTGGLYEILCGTDYAGGDMGAKTASTFEACIDLCDATAGCIDVSYVAPSCYMKNQLNAAVPVGHVWTAKLLKSAADIFRFPEATATNQGTGVESVVPGPVTLESPPLATLAPLPPPGVDMGSLAVLEPKPETQLWYNGGNAADSQENASDSSVTVRLSVTYQYPSVVLDHSIYIQNVDCSSGSLGAIFNGTTAYLHAASEWPSIPKILFITSSPKCGVNGQNAFFLTDSISFDISRQAFQASGKMVELGDVFENMDVDFGNVQPSNSSSSSNSSSTCGSPSASVVDGLPAVPCGDDFDKNMDEHLGFYSQDMNDMQAVITAASPGLETSPTLQRRWGWLKKAFNAVVKVVQAVQKVVVQVVKAVAPVIAQVIQKAATFVVAVAKAVVTTSIAIAVNVAKLAVFVVTGNYSNSMNLPVNLAPPAALSSVSPWGPAFKFYTFTREKTDPKFSAEQNALEKIEQQLIGEADPSPGIELWCVNCGVKGNIKATGSISATPLKGLTKGEIAVDGNMYVGAYVGVNAFAQWEKTVRRDLFVKGLPGWSIPGIVSLGPRLILGVQATIGVEAEGQLLTGASLSWPKFQAKLDFVDSSRSTKSGWTPIIDKKFEAHGSVSATAALGLPVTVNFGIDILNGRWNKGVNLTDFPAITAKAEFELDLTEGSVTVGNDECQGVAWDISLTNEVKLQISDSSLDTQDEAWP